MLYKSFVSMQATLYDKPILHEHIIRYKRNIYYTKPSINLLIFEILIYMYENLNLTKPYRINF